MFTFMDYIQNAFYSASHWNRDNSYSTLTATAQALLDFQTPRGLHLHISSLPTPNLATSYSLNNVGLVDGSFSYLYSSLPLLVPSKSSKLDLHSVVRGYRQILPLRAPDPPWWRETWHRGKRVDTRDTLLYGRLFLPQNALEVLYMKRLTPTRLLKVSAVSDAALPNGGTILALFQNDYGKYSTEYLYSSDSALLGVRGLYNFGPDPRDAAAASQPPLPAIFSAGAEAYYGVLNKSGGISTGIRFTTLPSHASFPYTMTLTLNPLMGNLSSTYAVKAGGNLALCSRFDFNFYSYESGVLVGCELWRLRRNREIKSEEWAKKMIREGWETVDRAVSAAGLDTVSGAKASTNDDDVTGVLKVRVNQDWKIGLLWEGRFKDLLFSVGTSLDLKRREQIFRGLGLEVQYSS
ncbi:mitochondrial distribution and morphology protein 10 [Trichodelitschia bisporula]|uniref:Mitochondrial distribution and morphology protein 10 n=1 Tax=Trichodelitschia bisporula TaxID=703511 RepID=A0A6G1HRH2_9PEZI|nr:mitochondrial distribution and morphology protein 10 [Trichodelitschia bisporula]